MPTKKNLQDREFYLRPWKSKIHKLYDQRSLRNKQFFSFLSEETTPCENLYYLDSHVTAVVSLQVSVFPSLLVELLCSNIASVFTTSFLEGSVTFPNVLFATVDARDAINNINIEASLQTPTPILTFVKEMISFSF